nr:hypothetical protein [Rhodoferax ferrireducens]
MLASQRACVDINDIGRIEKKRAHELGRNAQYTVLAIDPNHFTIASQLLPLPMDMHLNRKMHMRTWILRHFSFEIDTGGADIAGQALNATDLDRQLRIESVSAPPMRQRRCFAL